MALPKTMSLDELKRKNEASKQARADEKAARTTTQNGR